MVIQPRLAIMHTAASGKIRPDAKAHALTNKYVFIEAKGTGRVPEVKHE